MDSAQYQLYPYDQSFRPNYPTPPPSFSQGYVGQYAYSPTANPVHIMRGMTQTPTPNHSVSPSPPLQDFASPGAAFGVNTSPSLSFGEQTDIVSISTVFHPGMSPLPDTALSSSDGVLFYVHSPTLVNACPGVFRSYTHLPISDGKFRHDLIILDAPSTELNIILHALYGSSPAAHSPEFDTLVAAVDRMPSYSILPQTIVRPFTPLYDLLLSHAPLRPLELYALGAHHKISTLAVSVSSHLLSYDLSSITDEMALRIGAVYLKKLVFLHSARFTALKDILLHPPHPHAETKECGFEDQRGLTRAWALVSAYLAWDGRADLSTHRMQAALQPLSENIKCQLCHEALQERIKDVVVKWASVKRTI